MADQNAFNLGPNAVDEAGDELDQGDGDAAMDDADWGGENSAYDNLGNLPRARVDPLEAPSRRGGPGRLYGAEEFPKVRNVIFHQELSHPDSHPGEYHDGYLPRAMGAEFPMPDGSMPFSAAEYSYWQGQRTHIFLRFHDSHTNPAKVSAAVGEWCSFNAPRLVNRRMTIKYNFEAMGGRAYVSPLFATEGGMGPAFSEINRLSERWRTAQQRYEE